MLLQRLPLAHQAAGQRQHAGLLRQRGLQHADMAAAGAGHAQLRQRLAVFILQHGDRGERPGFLRRDERAKRCAEAGARPPRAVQRQRGEVQRGKRRAQRVADVVAVKRAGRAQAAREAALARGLGAQAHGDGTEPGEHAAHALLAGIERAAGGFKQQLAGRERAVDGAGKGGHRAELPGGGLRGERLALRRRVAEDDVRIAGEHRSQRAVLRHELPHGDAGAAQRAVCGIRQQHGQRDGGNVQRGQARGKRVGAARAVLRRQRDKGVRVLGGEATQQQRFIAERTLAAAALRTEKELQFDGGCRIGFSGDKPVRLKGHGERGLARPVRGEVKPAFPRLGRARDRGDALRAQHIAAGALGADARADGNDAAARVRRDGHAGEVCARGRDQEHRPAGPGRTCLLKAQGQRLASAQVQRVRQVDGEQAGCARQRHRRARGGGGRPGAVKPGEHLIVQQDFAPAREVIDDEQRAVAAQAAEVELAGQADASGHVVREHRRQRERGGLLRRLL